MSGKPHLAMDGHRESVRVLLTVKTMATVSSLRVSQFMSDEKARNISFLQHIPIAADGEYLDTLPRISENEELPLRQGFNVLPSEGPPGKSSTLPINPITSEENGIEAVTGIEEEAEVIAGKENIVVTTEEQLLTSEFPNGPSELEERHSEDSTEASLHLDEKDQLVNGLDKHPAVKEIDTQVSEDESKPEGDESKPEGDESKPEGDESKLERNDSKPEEGESKPERDESKPGVEMNGNNEDLQQQKPQVTSSTLAAEVSLNAKKSELLPEEDPSGSKRRCIV